MTTVCNLIGNTNPTHELFQKFAECLGWNPQVWVMLQVTWLSVFIQHAMHSLSFLSIVSAS